MWDVMKNCIKNTMKKRKDALISFFFSIKQWLKNWKRDMATFLSKGKSLLFVF